MPGTHGEDLVTMVATALPEGSLARDAKEQADAFAVLYAEYFAFVWRCLLRLGVPRSGLDDAAQDVFVVVHRRLAQFEARSSVRTWLYGIVRNVAFKRHRARQRKPTEPLDTEPASASPGPHEHAEALDAARFVQAFVATLEPRQREVFVPCVLEQMSVPEVAEALGIPLNTGYTRLRLARAAFQRALARYAEAK